MIRAYYYTAIVEGEEFSPVRPLVDWLDYNGFTVVTKPVKRFTDAQGHSRTKGNMDMEIAVDMLELARALAEDQEENKFLDADTSMPPAGSPAPVSVNRGKRDGGAIAEWSFCGVLRSSIDRRGARHVRATPSQHAGSAPPTTF